MKILNDATSPFGRKVVVAAMERSISFEEVFVDLAQPGLERLNPLAQIPTLVPESGDTVYDSDVILVALDRFHNQKPLVPFGEFATIMTRVSLANGLMEATMTRLMEMRRPSGHASAALIIKLESRISRVLSSLALNASALAEEKEALRGDQISVAVALGYVDFRYSEAWHAEHQQLSAWYRAIASRESMVQTHPQRDRAVSSKSLAKPNP